MAWGLGFQCTVTLIAIVVGDRYLMYFNNCTVGAPAYIGEMAPPHIRGLLMSLKEAAIVLGILFGYLIGFLLADINGGWGLVYGVAAAPAGIMLMGTFMLHESKEPLFCCCFILFFHGHGLGARWLFLNGFVDEAFSSLNWVFPPPIADATYEDLSMYYGWFFCVSSVGYCFVLCLMCGRNPRCER